MEQVVDQKRINLKRWMYNEILDHYVSMVLRHLLKWLKQLSWYPSLKLCDYDVIF
ncbi:MAG: hypothetical protein IMW92_14565 [Bacillales bacterium]|nr:hypothetical protein [Bacillales bacterium]